MNTVDRNFSQGGHLLTPAEGLKDGLNAACVEILEDGTIFAALVNSFYDGGAALTNRTWRRGDRIWGTTQELQLSAGAVLAHRLVL